MISLAREYGPTLGLAATCLALGLPRASFYRHGGAEHREEPAIQPSAEHRDDPGALHGSEHREEPEDLHVQHDSEHREEPGARPRPKQALSEPERQEVLSVLHEDRFVDLAPTEVYAQLLDEGRRLCSIRTMYRILAAHNEVRERRAQLRHPAYAKPELLATGPNQVWSWDITKLLGPAKWTYFYLYVILDIFSRYVVGWLLAEAESSELAKTLIRTSCERQHIQPGQLTLHADRGTSMTSHSTAQLIASLGLTRTHSRPHVSNDNPFSEAQFKTLKYQPRFPARFGSFEDAEGYCQAFFAWYNEQHHHVGLGLMTPQDVHTGEAKGKWERRAVVLREAYAAHPERFPLGVPLPPPLPEAAWINPPPAKGAAPAKPANGRASQSAPAGAAPNDESRPSAAPEEGGRRSTEKVLQ